MRAFPFVTLRASLALVLMCGLMTVLLLVSSCGRVAPTVEPGSITITSTPSGATIFFDGEDTGEITPFVFSELIPDLYVVAVEMEGFFAPDSETLNLGPADHVTQNFALSSDAPTQLLVTSNPAGAAIFMDGNDTGEVTPATISGLEAGDVTVSLNLDGRYVSPAGYTVTIVEHETTELPIDTFIFRSKKTVMVEGFSNVDCAGCPELATNVEALMHLDGYELDRVLYCKFSMFWPSALDPHYRQNIDENNARKDYYISDLGGGIPMMTIEGSRVTGSGPNNTPTASEMATMIDVVLDQVPGFLIDITADFSNTTVPLSATVTAMEDVDLTGHTLYIALVQDFLEYEEAPGNQGETEFHWLFRDRVDTLPTLGAMTTGQTVTFDETVNRDDWDLDTLHVIAFVQNDVTRAILQAGISTTAAPSPAALFLDDNTLNRPTAGGNRP